MKWFCLNQITCLFLLLVKILFWNVCRHLNKLKQILRKKVVWKRVIVLSWLWNILHYNLRKDIILKLYCGFRYTTLCMINCILVLKQLWLHDNGHTWFHLQRLRWPVRNGEGAKKSKMKYLSPGDSNQYHANPRQESQRLRSLRHESLMVISG